jgi:UDP-glucose 4-epimerase
MITLQNKRYAVTGAAGFIGSHIAEEIYKQGKEVICIDNLEAGRRKNLFDWFGDGCKFVQADVRDLNTLIDAFSGVDIVFHEACSKCTVCRKDPYKDLTVNAMGSFNVFEAARVAGVKKVVHASTGSVNRGQPVSFYGVSKLSAESYLRAFKEYYPEFRFTSIRYHHVFGSRQESGPDGGVIPIFIRRMLNDLPITIFGDGNQQRHFTYVKDVVDLNFECETLYDGEYINFAEVDSTTINELVTYLSDVIGSEPVVIYEAAKPGDIKKFDITKNVCSKTDDYRKRFLQNLKKTAEYYERSRSKAPYFEGYRAAQAYKSR